jgi:NAD(P)H-flavin reductase
MSIVESSAGRADRGDLLEVWRVLDVRPECEDVVTLSVHPLTGRPPIFRPAQFSMIGVPGVGEAPISISSPGGDRRAHQFTIRAVGAVTARLVSSRVGDVVTIRGPFGRPWDLDAAHGRRALFVAGGIGIAPLRSAIHELVGGHRPHPDVHVLMGATEPGALVYRDWLESLTGAGVRVSLAVDRVPDDAVNWPWHTGVVTDLITDAVDTPGVEAFLCGPDPMMTAAVRTLQDCGVSPGHMQLTLERNMQCGTGTCGHCQLGPLIVCRDGPVVRADELGRLLEVGEL